MQQFCCTAREAALRDAAPQLAGAKNAVRPEVDRRRRSRKPPCIRSLIRFPSGMRAGARPAHLPVSRDARDANSRRCGHRRPERPIWALPNLHASGDNTRGTRPRPWRMDARRVAIVGNGSPHARVHVGRPLAGRAKQKDRMSQPLRFTRTSPPPTAFRKFLQYTYLQIDRSAFSAASINEFPSKRKKGRVYGKHRFPTNGLRLHYDPVILSYHFLRHETRPAEHDAATDR